MKSSVITLCWASSQDGGQAKHISEVKSGLLCACVCPGCGAVLEAVNSQNPHWKKRPHFRHHRGDEAEDCGEAAFKVGTHEAFKSIRVINIPSEQGTSTTPVSVVSLELTDTTDAILTLADGQRVLVRLLATSKFEGASSAQQGLTEILIDISDPLLRYAPLDELRKHIELTGHRRWCPRQDVQVVESSNTGKVPQNLKRFEAIEDNRERLRAMRWDFQRRASGDDISQPEMHGEKQVAILKELPRPVNLQRQGFWLDTRGHHEELIGRDLAKWMELHSPNGGRIPDYN